MQRKGPLPGKIFARCIPERPFAGLFGCTARISCRSQPVLDARRRYVAANWRFSRPRPLRERMKRKSCHGSPPENASRRYLATVGRRGAHFCHRRALGNAPRRYLATGKRPGTHHGIILPRLDARRTPRVPRHRTSHGPRWAHRQTPRHAPYAALLPPLKK